MRPIQMVDVVTEYRQLKAEIDAAVIGVLESGAFIGGPAVGSFANALAEYHGATHCVPCANGTDALQIAMMALDLQPGDEVLTPSFTYIATTEVVALLRLKPVFVDVDPKTFCMDPEDLRRKITPRSKAVVPVHLYGHSAPMEAILSIAAEHGLQVIEDNAQAIGATYRFPDGREIKTGAIGRVGATSFYPSKNLGAFGDGGALITSDADLAHTLKMVANHGQQTRYYHERVGCNSRLDTIQAAILEIKLRHLDAFIAARQKVARFYDNAFADSPGITTPYTAPYSTHVYHQYTLILDGIDRDALQAKLAEAGVPSMIYYPVPAHRQQMFASAEALPDLPVTDWLTSRVISLPIHTQMEESQLDHIVNTVRQLTAQ